MCLLFLFTKEFWLGEADPPSDVKEVFANYSSTKMSTKNLHDFLVHRQGNTDEEARKIGETIFKHKFKHPLSLKDFHRYLFDVELNSPIKASEVKDDMHAPLSHYFVFTGHNSYLSGNQLTSESGVDPIIKALQKGVRVIELDIWPNSSDDDIEVYHGNTLTSRVKFVDCLEAIKEHAFSASPYPVVLNFENHLTPELQAKAATMVKQTFGDLLFYPKISSMKEFPSPQSLMNRIIVSAEPPTDVNTSSEYNNIITIKDGKPKDGLLKETLSAIDSNNVSQLNLEESDLQEASESYAPDLARFSLNNIIRVYPKGLRIDSSNYDPFPGWINGAQMVAFNMQGDGRFLWLMHGFFLANGGCGYVKKPNFLLHNHLHPQSTLVPLPVKKTLKVKIYTGHGWRSDFTKSYFDICSPPDFYVEIGVFGAPSDAVTFKTKKVEDSWTPVWKEEFSFPLTVPELAVLSIEVSDSEVGKDDFAGQVSFPVSELKNGIRAVPLLDRNGDKLASVKLLMRFDIT
ncbi:Phosphoinositide phospholipase C [Zostera marina]|uniref:Phosphoinositide phospholipase C n=1 Tax=Zostera marina TaxID=29655 RepID=A0A0K9PC98_ZOSMR|nr:Phosphoinositide phospholipase C [Zostera marina]